jgi:hypothetical protein
MASNWDGFFPDTFARLLVPASGWVARVYLWSVCHQFGCAIIPPLDVAIAWGHWWANQPMSRINPDTFGNRSNGTAILLLPITIALVFLFFDLKRLYEGA